ncbi:MAG: hypothetical protein GXO63_02255 [Candidatus Micrarchaeota archaeon]|nr:hypothetical protein [Candidatus Micrarchaeota archaeon]
MDPRNVKKGPEFTAVRRNLTVKHRKGDRTIIEQVLPGVLKLVKQYISEVVPENVKKECEYLFGKPWEGIPFRYLLRLDGMCSYLNGLGVIRDLILNPGEVKPCELLSVDLPSPKDRNYEQKSRLVEEYTKLVVTYAEPHIEFFEIATDENYYMSPEEYRAFVKKLRKKIRNDVPSHLYYTVLAPGDDGIHNHFLVLENGIYVLRIKGGEPNNDMEYFKGGKVIGVYKLNNGVHDASPEEILRQKPGKEFAKPALEKYLSGL